MRMPSFMPSPVAQSPLVVGKASRSGLVRVGVRVGVRVRVRVKGEEGEG